MIGGATTSKMHTAVKIEPFYKSAPVVHVLDASRSVVVVQKLKNTDDQEEYASDIRTEYDDLRREYYDSQKDKAFVSLGKARSKKMKTDWDNVKIIKPTFLGTKVYK